MPSTHVRNKAYPLCTSLLKQKLTNVKILCDTRYFFNFSFLGPAAVAKAQGLVEDFLNNYHKAVFPDKKILGMPLGLMHVDKSVEKERISNPLMPICINPQPVHLKRGKTKKSLDSEGRRSQRARLR